MKPYFLCIGGLVIVGHQMARMILFPMIADDGGIIEITPFFNLVEVWNHGISFGMFKGLAYGQWLLSGISLIITAVLAFLFQQAQDRLSSISYSLIMGGALGNVADRLRFGGVADYLDFHILDYHWPAFNLTDVAIVCGVFLLLAFYALPKKLINRSCNQVKPQHKIN